MKFFVLDGSDLNGIRSPLEIRYMKYLRILLIMIGAWPGEAFGEKDVHRSRLQAFFLILGTITFTTALIFIKNTIGKMSFLELGPSYITTLMNLFCLTRFWSLFITKRLEKPIVNFVRDIHLFNYRSDSKSAAKTNLYIHKISYMYTVYTIVQVALVPVFFNATVLMNNISNGGFTGQLLLANKTYEHSVYYTLPFDYEQNFTGFLVVFICNCYICFCAGNFFLHYDLAVALMVFHIWGHLKILTYNLEHLPRPGFVFKETRSDTAVTSNTARYSNEELIEVNRQLRSIVTHHRSILMHIANISKAIGFNIALYYFFHQICGCILLLECTQSNLEALLRFGPLTVCLFQLLVTLSVIFELLKSMTDHVVRAAYNTPWEYMDVKNRRLVLMLMRQTQVPLGLKAAGVVEVGVQTMLTILKTTLSYYMMLRTTAFK